MLQSFVVGLLLGLLLPVSIYFEFNKQPWYYYPQMYSHLMLFPAFFIWPILAIWFQLIAQVENWSDLYLWFITAGGLSVYALLIELRGDQMMLFEIKAEGLVSLNRNRCPVSVTEYVENLTYGELTGASRFYMLAFSQEAELLELLLLWVILFPKCDAPELTPINKELKNNFQNNSDFHYDLNLFHTQTIHFIKTNQQFNTQEKKWRKWFDFILSYPKLWKENKGLLSISRIFYLFLFLVIVFLLLTILFFFVYYLVTANTKGFVYTCFCCFYLIIWLPLRSYNQQVVKNLLFQEIQGKLEIFIYVALVSILIFLLIFYKLVLSNISWYLIAQPLFILISIIIVLILPNSTARIFGLESAPKNWIILFMVLGLLNWLVLNQLFTL